MGGEPYKIPLLAQRKRLPALPGQQEGVSYGMIWGACPLPANGSCYVVRFESDTQVRILGYVSDEGEVFAAEEPLTLAPSARPELALVPDERGVSGTVYLRCGAAALEPYSRYRGSFRGVMREVSETETWNSSRTMGFRAFAASLYLRYCVIETTRLRGASAGEAGRAHGGARRPAVSLAAEPLPREVHLLEGFRDLALPDALEAALFRWRSSDEPSGIERFALRLCARIDVDRLRELTERAHVSLAYIRGIDSLYLNFARDGLEADDILFLFGVEATLNRLCAVGGRFGSVVEGLSSSPSEEACSLIDQQVLRGMTAWVERSLARSVAPNGWAEIDGTSCKPGGEWDLRTRFATLCEDMAAVVRLEYEYDCDAAAGVLHVRFSLPDAYAMPRELYDADAGAWVELDRARCERMAAEYGARMVLAFAAAAFASKIALRRCTVVARDLRAQSESSYLFERAGFMAALVPFAKKLDGAPLERQAALERISGLAADEPFGIATSAARRVAPAEDDRPLSPALRDLLLADTARELEVMESGPDEHAERVAELRDIARDDPARAEAGLVALIEELEAGCAAAEFMSDVPLISRFCQNRVGRVLLPLWEDDPAVRIHRAPDALFFAHHELELLYFNAGAFDRALDEARRLLDMAGTSTLAHAALVNVLARMERYDEVIEVAKHGLRIATDRDSIAYLLYRVAFAYWRTGEPEVGMACYRMVPRGEQMSEMARSELAQLMGEMGRTEEPSVEEAAALMEGAGMPVPPGTEALHQLEAAAMLLVDEGFFTLAYDCVYTLWLLLGSDELGAVGRSLRA